MTRPADRPTVSVALCTHNGERFVGQQVTSILNQSVPVDEIVVGDDASRDGTVAVIEAAVADARGRGLEIDLTIVRREAPLGVAKNFEDTVARTTGDLVALSDQDDVWPADRVARLIPVFSDPAVMLVHSDARLVDADGVPTGGLLLDALDATARERRALTSGHAFGVLLRRNLVTGATAVTRGSFARGAPPIGEGWIHDEWFAMVAALSGGVRLVPEPLLDYRQHGGNQIGASAVDWERRKQKLTEARDERAARLIARAASIAGYADAHPEAADARNRETLHRKLAHEQWRASLPVSRVARVPRVAAAAVCGRYHRYNRGLIDVARDLVQPATARSL
jgi:glycosyltransferase involved in cell wall biosynthesis